jgi:hypothetical protein
MWHHIAWKLDTNISQGYRLHHHSMKEAASSSETPVPIQQTTWHQFLETPAPIQRTTWHQFLETPVPTQRTTWHHILEDHNLDTHYYKNLKPQL